MLLLHNSLSSSSGSSFVVFFLLILAALSSAATAVSATLAFCPPARRHRHHHHHNTNIPSILLLDMSSSSSSAEHETPTTTTLGNVIDGKAIADAIRAELAQSLSEALSSASNDIIRPGLAVMLVGDRTDSQTYVRMKQKACADCGITSFLREFKDTITEETLLETIRAWNRDDTIHGILIQLPLPPNIEEARILSAVLPSKDVDGLHPANVARLFHTATRSNEQPLDWKRLESIPFHIPCTPQGCVELLDRSSIPIQQKRAVVVGRSNLVGLPVAMLLLHRNATVTVVHSQTGPDVESIVRSADIVVAAAGRANVVRASWLKTGCAVIDVGINSVEDAASKRGYRLVGDVDYDAAKEVAGWITPVPGGVGPMTIAMLLRNTLNSWRRARAAAAAADAAAAGITDV